MTLLFCDSFDHYGTGYIGSRVAEKWTGVAGSIQIISAGPSGNCLELSYSSEYVTQAIPNTETVIIGFDYWNENQTPSTAVCLMSIRDATSAQIAFYLDSLWRIYARVGNSETNGGTWIANTPNYVISPATWHRLEFKITIGNTTGAIELRIDGVTKINSTGIDTQTTANAYLNAIRFRTTNNELRYFDNFYILDTSGDIANDFTNGASVKILRPNGVGNKAEWDRYPDTGEANWQNVDDSYADGTTYNHITASGSPATDLHTMQDLTITSGLIYGVQTVLSTYRDGDVAHTIYPEIRSAGTNYTISGGHVPISTYKYYCQIIEKDPATDQRWTVSGINNMQLGYTRLE